MSHVADGELHAWLDGALEHEAPEEAARVATHLEACSDCRARLERARALRERADELLGAAAPLEAGLPPFEEVAARARARGGGEAPAAQGGSRSEGAASPWSRWNGPLRTLAWAASLLLGVGIGWAGRAAWQSGPEQGGVVATAEPAPAEPAEAFEAPSRAAGDRAAGTPADASGEARGESDTVAGEKLARVAPTGVAEPEPAAESETLRQERPAEAGAPAAEEARLRDADRSSERAEAARVELDEALPAREAVRPSVDVQGLGADAPAAAAGRGDAGAPVWVPAAPADAARWVGGSLLAVEGLALEDQAVSIADGRPVARVRQRLPSGRLLEVRMRPASEARANLEDAASGAWTRVDGLEVRLRGPVAPDSLAVLVSRLRARRP